MLSTTDKTNITNRSSYHNSPIYISDNNHINNIPEYNNDDDEEAKNNFQTIKEKVKISPILHNSNELVQRELSQINKQELEEIEIENNNFRKLESLKDSSNLIAVYDDAENRFTFYNSNKSILGSFNFRQIIKYIGKQIEPTFYNFVESGYSEELIKSMIGEVLIDPITGKINIILKSHLESPFMGNLDLLIKLNNSFFKYETSELMNDIAIVNNEKIQYNLKISIKQFIYLLINHTLKIVSIASEDIKNDPAQTEMKNKLLKYSVALTYRISNFMKEHIDNYNVQYKKLYGNLEKLINMKKVINNKVNNLEEKITKQNNLIYSIINKGKKSESTTISTIMTDKDFDKLFENDDKNSDNFYDSEFIENKDKKNNSDEKYLLSDTINDNSDISDII
jgi:hypothetical protein